MFFRVQVFTVQVSQGPSPVSGKNMKIKAKFKKFIKYITIL